MARRRSTSTNSSAALFSKTSRSVPVCQRVSPSPSLPPPLTPLLPPPSPKVEDLPDGDGLTNGFAVYFPDGPCFFNAPTAAAKTAFLNEFAEAKQAYEDGWDLRGSHRRSSLF